MAAILGQGKPKMIGEKRHFFNKDKTDGIAEVEPARIHNGNGNVHEEKKNQNDAQDMERVQYRSEYAKNFRDFNQYDYVDGKFVSRDRSVTPASRSWYAEVIELRKKAGEYRQRGWGTEFLPQNLVEGYNKQMALWEHVSRRSTLSALTLASTIRKPKALDKDDKNKNSARKYRQHRSMDRAPASSYKKIDKYVDQKRPATAKSNKDTSGTDTARTHIVSNAGSAEKSESRTGSSSSPNKPVRPTTLVTSNVPSHPRRDKSISARKKELLKSKLHSTPSSKADNSNFVHSLKKKMDELDSYARTSDMMERMVISPAEPTRVKSPEEIMMKSPDPVNWTVPLDTGKPFTVTQNIPDDDIYHHRTPSESRQFYQGISSPVNDNMDSLSSLRADDVSLNSRASTMSSDFSSSKPNGKNIPELTSSHRLNGVVRNTDVFPITSEEQPMSIIETVHDYEKSKLLASSLTAASKQLTTIDEPVSLEEPSKISNENSPPVSISSRISSAEIADAARNRFDQFWNKPMQNGNESL